MQGGGENSQGSGTKFWLASLAICHPPDQNAETASDSILVEEHAVQMHIDFFLSKTVYHLNKQKIDA
jgi:hypothetical protein